MHQIYFLTLCLGETVHAQALGFTRQIYLYAWACNEAAAKDIAVAYCAAKSIAMDCCTAKVAVNQTISSYTFVEQIYGLPESKAEEVIRSRGYPEELMQECLQTLKRNVRMIEDFTAVVASTA